MRVLGYAVGCELRVCVLMVVPVAWQVCERDDEAIVYANDAFLVRRRHRQQWTHLHLTNEGKSIN